jgi:hypothetical protein
VRCLGRATARDDDSEVLRDPWSGRKKNRGSEKQEKKKQTVGLRDPRPEKQEKKNLRPTAGKMARPLPPSFFFLLSSFFFLFSFFLVENLVLLGVEFFCAFFSH